MYPVAIVVLSGVKYPGRKAVGLRSGSYTDLLKNKLFKPLKYS